MNLSEEQRKISELLANKAVRQVFRDKKSEAVIEFKDGSSFIVDISGKELEFSVTAPIVKNKK